jgi:luciferase family oxidoreductase group 1
VLKGDSFIQSLLMTSTRKYDMKNVPLSILELATVRDGSGPREALQSTVEVAKHVEKLGYNRIWMAEHHNMEHIASSATSVLIGLVASHTQTIRVGSGGVMLPNHSPLQIAEQFGTLETIYPDRIDLGLGRAAGTDQVTAMALRRNNVQSMLQFPSDVKELIRYFNNSDVKQPVRAFPGEGLNIPIWILGSSHDSAYLAAQMGLPYVFAAHFAPAHFSTAVRLYRQHFQPSEHAQKPYVMACVNAVGADTVSEAEHLLTSLQRMYLGILTNVRSPLKAPGPLPPFYFTEEVQKAVGNMLTYTFVGDSAILKQQLSSFVKENELDEIMINSPIFDMEAKKNSFSILKEAFHG